MCLTTFSQFLKHILPNLVSSVQILNLVFKLFKYGHESVLLLKLTGKVVPFKRIFTCKNILARVGKRNQPQNADDGDEAQETNEFNALGFHVPQIPHFLPYHLL